MLQRFAGGPPANEVAKRSEFFFAQRPVELHVEVHASESEHMGEKMLDVEARAFDPGFCEISRSGLQDFEDGLHLIWVR